MRISDWSSDVCSSDLGEPLLPSSSDGHLCPARRQERLAARAHRRPDTDGEAHCRRLRARLQLPLARSEERRVGKECVRVDLGGRRIIKKKIKEEHQYTNTNTHIFQLR